MRKLANKDKLHPRKNAVVRRKRRQRQRSESTTLQTDTNMKGSNYCGTKIT